MRLTPFRFVVAYSSDTIDSLFHSARRWRVRRRAFRTVGHSTLRDRLTIMEQVIVSSLLSVVDILGNARAHLGRDVRISDVTVALSCQQLDQDVTWMLSKEWLDGCVKPATAVLDRTRAIQLCRQFLSAEFQEAVGFCFGFPTVDAIAIGQVNGTLQDGTRGFAYNLVNLKSLIVEGQEII